MTMAKSEIIWHKICDLQITVLPMISANFWRYLHKIYLIFSQKDCIYVFLVQFSVYWAMIIDNKI